MAAIVYPATLPTPKAAPIQSAERRLKSPGDGPREVRTIERNWRAEQRVTWPAMSDARAAIFRAWWEDDLIEGGAWFAATWPLPQGMVTAYRRFIGAPRWEYLGNGFWRVSAVMEVHARGESPTDGADGGGGGDLYTLWDYWDFENGTLSGSDIQVEGTNGGLIKFPDESIFVFRTSDYSLSGANSLAKAGSSAVTDVPATPSATNWEFEFGVLIAGLSENEVTQLLRASFGAVEVTIEAIGPGQQLRLNGSPITTLSAGWNVITCRVTDDDEEFYVNDALVLSTSRISRGYASSFSIGSWELGGCQDDPDGILFHYIDDIRISGIGIGV